MVLVHDIVDQILGGKGSTRPETRLMAISSRPKASSQRRGRTSAQISGRTFAAPASLLCGASRRHASGGRLRLSSTAGTPVNPCRSNCHIFL